MLNQDLTIIKIGTGVLTLDDGTLNISIIEHLSKHLSMLKKNGENVILVSSGAVGAGVPLLGLKTYPEDISMRQAAAAVGQPHLMQTYQEAFSAYGLQIAQILLSSYDLKEATHKERAASVITSLIEEKDLIPIINENDVVSLRELTKTDNDMLAANLASILGAKTLILLTSVDGLLDLKGQLVPSVSDIQNVAKSFIVETSGKFSIGGMASKLDAVMVAQKAGVNVIIGNGMNPERLTGYLDRTSIGTYF